MNWSEWHKYYDSLPNLQERLRIVSAQIARALDECPSGPIQIVSICAGDGRDLIGTLRNHPRREDVIALLVDNDPKSIQRGIAEAARIGLSGKIRFREADATQAKYYLGYAPADIVLLSGFLGHLRHSDVPGLIKFLPMFCNSGGQVIWSRHLLLHSGHEQVPLIRKFFVSADFSEIECTTTDPRGFAVGRARFEGKPQPLDASRVLFEFIGLDRLLLSERLSTPVSSGALRHTLSASVDILPEAETTIPAKFRKMVTRFPDRPAIDGGDWQPNYTKFEEATNRLASALLTKGGKAGDRVALLMRHDAPLIAATLSVLKAGRIVVVLNPTDPPSRLKQILDDSEAGVIFTDLTNENLAKEIAQAIRTVVCFEKQKANLGVDPRIDILPTDTAWLIYTSGSTGRPKGVIQTHRNIVHNVIRLSRGMELTALDRIVLLASPSGGLGVATTWCALLTGAALLPFSITDNGVSSLKGLILGKKATVLVFSASVFRSFVKTLETADFFPRVRLVRIGSETIRTEDFASFRKHFSKDCVLLNSLSSSETGNITQHRFGMKDNPSESRLPVGTPAEGVGIALLDEQGREVGNETTGEVIVMSHYLSPGYWRNEPLTVERFSEDQNGVRTYSSGDLARWNAQGELVYVDRVDSRVKIAGYRVELSEIEEGLAQQPEVQRSLVSARASTTGEIQLVAHVVVSTNPNGFAEILRQRLRKMLPAYTVPAHIFFLESFPLTPHGKIDRDALPQPEENGKCLKSEDIPNDMVESRLTQIWESVLGISPIGRRDDFFELGGTSLQSVEILLHIENVFEVSLPPSILNDGNTIEKLAAMISPKK